MKAKNFILWAGLLTAFVAAVAPVIASAQMQQEMTPDQKKMMAQMEKYGTPGKEHEFLKRYVGEWDVDISAWQDPMAQPEKSKGTMKNTLLFEGRYLKCDFEGAMGPMRFQGLEVIGYDLFKKLFTTFWVDSWSTAFMVTTGTLDAAGNVLTETAMSPDPMTDGKTMQKVKLVTTFLNDGKYKFEMYMVMPDGKEMKGMEMVCTRKM